MAISQYFEKKTELNSGFGNDFFIGNVSNKMLLLLIYCNYSGHFYATIIMKNTTELFVLKF